MNDKMIREKIDAELNEVRFTETMKENVLNGKKRQRAPRGLRYAVTAMLLLLFGGTTVFAGYHLLNRVNVNETTLPEIDEMKVVQISLPEEGEDGDGRVCLQFFDPDFLQEELGLSLLESRMAEGNPYMQGEVETDRKNYMMIRIKNYIAGDTDHYVYLKNEERYRYDHGEVFYSPVSLEADIILSEEQLHQGWERDYLGLYEFVESYRSEQGWKVNLIQDTVNQSVPEEYISEKCAVFVVDGIRYTLKGRVSLETMKEIIDSMEK